MRSVFRPDVVKSAECVVPFDGKDFEVLRQAASCWRGTWKPVLVGRHDPLSVEKAPRPSVFPWLFQDSVVFRSEAFEAMKEAAGSSCSILELSSDVPLFMLNVLDLRDALVEEQSEIVRFASGRLMLIERHCFDPSKLTAARFFKIPQDPIGTVYFTEEVADLLGGRWPKDFGMKRVWSG